MRLFPISALFIDAVHCSFYRPNIVEPPDLGGTMLPDDLPQF